jgi:hypothetical protein
MPRDAVSSTEAVLRVRKERLHSTMLVEILALLVFLAMGFALVSSDEQAAQPLLDRIRHLESDLADRDKQVRELQVRVRGLEIANGQLAESLRRFAQIKRGTLPANDRIVVLPQDQFASITHELANNRALLDERQNENASLRAKLTASGKGGSDLPNCPVTPGLIISVDLQANGSFAGHSLWSPSAIEKVRESPGLTQLASGRSLSRGEFQRLAQQVQNWGRSQTPQCGFRARVKAKHGNLNEYLDQHRVVAQYFYTAW